MLNIDKGLNKLYCQSETLVTCCYSIVNESQLGVNISFPMDNVMVSVGSYDKHFCWLFQMVGMYVHFNISIGSGIKVFSIWTLGMNMSIQILLAWTYQASLSKDLDLEGGIPCMNMNKQLPHTNWNEKCI
jgi:hypothetical protein